MQTIDCCDFHWATCNNGSDTDELSKIHSQLNNSHSLTLGLIAAIVSTICYGSSLVPIKKIHTGDGLFFQWTLCSACFIYGLVVQLIRPSPFWPTAAIGGAFWAAGNLLTVPVVKMIGMSLGMVIWSRTNLITGWLTGRFGMIGLCEEIPANPVLNYIGFSLSLVSTMAFLLIKPESAQGGSSQNEDQIYDKIPKIVRRLLGVSMSLLAGMLYGLIFLPAIYVQNHYATASRNGLDYVFSCMTGLFLASNTFLLIYCVVMKNSPIVNRRAILPGVASGVIWATGTTAWYIANSELTEAIAFPIVTSGPAIVATCWGIFAFGELRGKRNYLCLAGAFGLAIIGAVLTAISRV